MKRQNAGFTLIEVMIVVAIIGIIVAVALPSYQSQMRETRRADATAVLLQARQQMERFYSKNYSYANPPAGTIPAKAPQDGAVSYYTLAVVSNATTFTITATPVNTQLGDVCGNLAINQAGQKGAKGSAPDSTSDADIDECWR